MNTLLLIDKPAGMTSHDVVARVRRILGEKSVGHLGTLDPMATGLLPMLTGRWTRLAKFFGALAKTYTGTICFGYATDTYDAEGTPAGELVVPELTLDTLQTWAAEMLGESEQMPPAFSAKKVSGKAAHVLARAGVAPQLRPARICISSFSVHDLHRNQDGSATASFRLTISAGGYVRSVAHTLGQRAGCGAHLASLCRVAAGPLRLADALTLPALEEYVKQGELAQMLPHPRAVLSPLPAVVADAATLTRMRNGMQVSLPEFSSAPFVRVFASQRELSGIAQRLAGVLFQPVVVLAEPAGGHLFV